MAKRDDSPAVSPEQVERDSDGHVVAVKSDVKVSADDKLAVQIPLEPSSDLDERFSSDSK